MPRENYSLMKYLLICYPKIARLSNNEGNTNSDEVRKEITSSGNPTLLNPLFAQLQHNQGAPGASYSKRVKKIFLMFTLMTLHLFGGKSRQFPLSKT